MRLLNIPLFIAIAQSIIAPYLFGKIAAPEQAYQVIQRSQNQSGTYDYYLEQALGRERTNKSLNRLSIISESQYAYPTPESGCGPTALLNILVWYQKFGLIEPFSREADIQKYKLDLFNEIDRRIMQKAGRARTEDIGTQNLDAAMVMDELVSELSDGELRVSATIIEAPLKLKNFMEMIPNFRAGYLSVRAKDRTTGEMHPSNHAVTFIRADRRGYITLGTWGQIYRGLLKNKGGEQWFIPSNKEHHELKILGLIQFTPFEQTGPVSR